MYDCQRRFLYLIIIIYLIIYISARVTYISARVTYIGARRGAGTCADATMRARHTRAAGRPAAVRARRAEGPSGGEYCKKQGGCVGFSDFMFTFARYRGGSGSRQRHLQERGGTDGGGQATLQADRTMHQVAGTMRQAAGTMHQVAGTMHQVTGTLRQAAGNKNKGQKIYII